MSVVIKEVTSKKELKKFVKFNIELYKGNPYHVPGLIEEEMVTLDKKKNPAFEVCDAIYFLVRHSHTRNNENATKIRNWNHYTP